MYKDRFKTYVKSKDNMNLDLIAFTNEIADAIGYNYPASFTLPLQTALIPLYYIRLFLDQVIMQLLANHIDIYFRNCGTDWIGKSFDIFSSTFECRREDIRIWNA